jgi:hypothetical protein
MLQQRPPSKRRLPLYPNLAHTGSLERSRRSKFVFGNPQLLLITATVPHLDILNLMNLFLVPNTSSEANRGADAILAAILNEGLAAVEVGKALCDVMTYTTVLKSLLADTEIVETVQLTLDKYSTYMDLHTLETWQKVDVEKFVLFHDSITREQLPDSRQVAAWDEVLQSKLMDASVDYQLGVEVIGHVFCDLIVQAVADFCHAERKV